MPDPADLDAAQRIGRLIRRFGPIPISLYMAECNGHYYATRDPFGAAGDFVTAPEISQMFGELIGLWCADLHLRHGGAPPAFVELGPGRGTLAADALRAMRQAQFEPEVHFVETSPVLRDVQAARVPQAQFHRDIAELPTDRPLIIVANEFFDALPVRQLIKTGQGWRERMMALDGEQLVPVAGQLPVDPLVPEAMRDAEDGTIIETCPAGTALASDLAQRLSAQGGAMLIIDYGYLTSQPGDTLQALYRHRFADLFDRPGEQDLTAHVDFAALAAAVADSGVRLVGPVSQAGFLRRLGIEARMQALIAGRDGEAAAAVRAAHDRLVDDQAMGTLFKVMAMVGPGWPAPEGFDG